MKLGHVRNYVNLQIEEEEKIGSPITHREFNIDHQNEELSIDFGNIDSIRHGEQAPEAHVIQARHGAMDIEDQLLITEIKGGKPEEAWPDVTF